MITALIGSIFVCTLFYVLFKMVISALVEIIHEKGN
jgi:hypothetical protein